MTEGQAAPKPRSRRIYVLWGAALTLLLAAGLFSWLVVVPVWKMNRTVGRYHAIPVSDGDHIGMLYYFPADPTEVSAYLETPEAVLMKIGGPVRAVDGLDLYLKMPAWATGNKGGALLLLGACGEPGGRILLREIERSDPRHRFTAAVALARVEPYRDAAARVLQELQTGRDPDVRTDAAEALKRVRDRKRLEKQAPQK